MTIYDELKSITSDLMSEFKQGTVKLIKIVSGSGPADDPGLPIETSHSLSAVVKGVSFKYVAQGIAVNTDLEITSAVLNSIIPSEKDFIEIDGIRYKIIQFIPIPASGVQVTWKLIVRKGG